MSYGIESMRDMALVLDCWRKLWENKDINKINDNNLKIKEHCVSLDS